MSEDNYCLCCNKSGARYAINGPWLAAANSARVYAGESLLDELAVSRKKVCSSCYDPVKQHVGIFCWTLSTRERSQGTFAPADSGHLASLAGLPALLKRQHGALVQLGHDRAGSISIGGNTLFEERRVRVRASAAAFPVVLIISGLCGVRVCSFTEPGAADTIRSRSFIWTIA